MFRDHFQALQILRQQAPLAQTLAATQAARPTEPVGVDLQHPQLAGVLLVAAVEAAHHHLAVFKKGLAGVAAVVLQGAVVVAADVAHRAEAVGAHQAAGAHELLLGGHMAADKAVQRRLAPDRQPVALRTDIDVVEAAGAAGRALAQPVDQLPGLEQVVLGLVVQPALGVDRALPGHAHPGHGLHQGVAIDAGAAGIDHGLDPALRPQP